MSETEGQCEICKRPCKQKCSRCKLVYYCSEEHQKEHWDEHKKDCKSYEINSNNELGRFLTAKKDLEPGEIIFIDTPLVVGPRPYKFDEGPFPCVGCCKILEKINACPECGWPACDPECPELKNPQRHGLECQILKLKTFKPTERTYEFFRFDILIVLRALFLQKINKKKWEVLLNLEDHLDDRGPKSEIFKTVQEKVNFLQQNYISPLKIYEKETEQTILPQASSDIMHKIYATLDVNATELTESADLFILYPIASLLEHNCVPNTCQTIDENDEYKVTFRAAQSIKKGEHITTTYTNILWGTQERKKHLKENKYFACMCDRCKDPTELNTYFSALICLGNEQDSCKGIQLPQNPTEDNPEWVCNKCGIKLPNKEINNFVEHLKKEVDKEIEKKPKLEELEEFLNKLEIFLHPNHYLVYTIKHSLVQLYKTEGEIEISNNFLADKLKMCQELIDVTKKLDPGNARLALYLAVLLNEQFMAKFKLLNRNFNSDAKEASNDLIKEIQALLEENKKCLEYEKQLETGAKLLQIAKYNEIKFNCWIEENKFSIFSKNQQKKWKVLLNLEDHLDDRGPKSETFKTIQEKVNFLQENYISPLKIYEKETEQTILPQASNDIMHKIYATLDVNATELTEAADLFILYPIASLLEQNCLPNTCQTIDENDEYKVTFRAAQSIKKDEHITTTYTNILWGTQARKKHLKENKYFACRCKDPTELNTYFSALIFLGNEQDSCKGIQLPQNPTEDNPEWVCNKCGIKLPNKEINNFVEHLKKEVDKEIEKKPKLEELEEFLNKLEIFLHPNHYLVYTIKHSLVQLYKTEGEIEISNSFLADKLKMCQELIDVTKKLDPGNARLALYLAVLLNEQFMAKFKLLNRNFNSDAKEASNDLIKEIQALLEENKKCLEYEKQLETGAKLLQIAKYNEIKFNRWIEENKL